MERIRIRHLAAILIFSLSFLAAADGKVLNSGQKTEISSSCVRLVLDKSRGYSLEAISYKGIDFDCKEAGGFPVFKLIKGGEIIVVSPDSRDVTSKFFSNGKDKIAVLYDYLGSKVKITYKLLPQGITIEYKILREKDYKFLSVQSKAGLVLISRDSLRDIKDAKIVVPVRQGLQIGFAPKKSGNFSSENNPFGLWNSIDSFGGWVMNANFASIIKDDTGMIVRPYEHSCKFLYGIKNIGGKERLFLDAPCYFRPIQTATDQMPLLRDHLGMEITFCGDENKDNEVNWVDIGIFYRDRYIKFSENTDKDIKEALVGKLHVGLGYNKLFAGIKEINFAPQIWWLTGAHVKGSDCYDQNWWVFKPDGSHGDYFKFKEDALKYGVRIGVHQNLDDVYQDEGWNSDEVRRLPNGELWKGGIWGGRQAYLRDINQAGKDKRIYKWIDEWFSIWNVKKGDTWHYDVLAAIELTENYDLKHPATKETDFCSRYAILKYAALRKGVKITSEMITEGLHEYLSFGLHNPCYYHFSELPSSIWEMVEEIPLYPVLFLGRTYVGDLERPVQKDTLSYAQSLLVGTKRVKWFGAISPEDAQDVYFKQNLFWSQICDLSVADIDREGNKFTVIYSDNSELTADLDKNAFVYKKGGIVYDYFSPFNSRGYMGVWANPYGISIREKNYVRSVSDGAANKCVFYPEGKLEVKGSYSGNGVSVLQKMPLAIEPEKKLTVELTGTDNLDDGRVKYKFKIQTEEKQIVTMGWKGSVDWFDEGSNSYLAECKDKLVIEINGDKVLSIIDRGERK